MFRETSYRNVVLTIDDTHVTIAKEGQDNDVDRSAPPLHTWTRDAFLTDRALHTQVEQLFDYVVLARARAVVMEPTLDPPFTPTHDVPSIQGRPQIQRVHSSGRGGGWCVWILGRKVRFSLREHKVDDQPFETILASGLPHSVQEGLPAEICEQVLAGVQALSPLPCMCGTGCETTDQHGSFRTFVYGNGNGPVEMNVQVGRCTVCGRGWSFREEGDSHYSFHYDVQPFDL